MNATTKTYAAKSSVTRALKAAGLNPASYTIETDGDKFYAVERDRSCFTPEFTCPVCGSEEVYAGHNVGGFVVDEDTVGGCHHCDWSFDQRKGKKAATGEKKPRNGNCRRVWEIADAMKGARRKDVIAACVEAGINLGTSKTQYQQWYASQRG